MGEFKRAPRSLLVIILAIIAIVALIGLSASVVIYLKQNSTVQNNDKEISNLQAQLSTPKLVGIGLQYTDNRSDPNTPFLQITGFVVNVGSTTANNCTIHVSTSQNGNATNKDTAETIMSVTWVRGLRGNRCSVPIHWIASIGIH